MLASFQRIIRRMFKASRALRPRSTLNVEQLESRCVPSVTYTVRQIGDNGGLGTLNTLTLRQAINRANLQPFAVGVVDIQFAIGAGNQTIQLNAPLVIKHAVNVDGTTQPGYDKTQSIAPVIEIKGTRQLTAGLDFEVKGSTVRALHITGFTGGDGVLLAQGSTAIYQCVIDRNSNGIDITSAHNTLACRLW